jgi:hypothetical protein
MILIRLIVPIAPIPRIVHTTLTILILRIAHTILTLHTHPMSQVDLCERGIGRNPA